jgi:hypothetical protein
MRKKNRTIGGLTVWRFADLTSIKLSTKVGFGSSSGAGMKTSTQTRTGLLGLLTILVLSSATMLWMFWHYPVATGIATLIILAALGISARLARWIDTDGLSDFKHTKA